MKYRALRGVCIGPERHLKLGETADLDSATGQFLISIAAVEVVKEPPPPADEPQHEIDPAADPEESPDAQGETGQKSTPAKPGKKEK
jgi:hypothetical protein